MALSTGAWTLAELDRLPDDGNTYELIDGELFVTPASAPAHTEALHIDVAAYFDEALGTK